MYMISLFKIIHTYAESLSHGIIFLNSVHALNY